MGKKYTDEDRKKIVEERGYKLLEISREKEKSGKSVVYVTVECKNGHIRRGRWGWFMSRDCNCYNNEKYDKEISLILKSQNEELLEVERKDKRTYVTVKCENGHITKRLWQGSNNICGCKYCNESKGEKRIAIFLENYKIPYIRQYRFDNCRLKYPLPFDFYLPQYNCCIEFDGLQHKYISEFFGGFDKFVSTIISDTVKTDYCKRNGIRLIRIPYGEMENIEKIIVNELELE